MHKEEFTFRKWDKKSPPEKVLVIRFHAIGDTALSLAACNSLRKKFPDSKIDFLTGGLSAPLVRAAGIFNEVYEFRDHSHLPQSSFLTRLDKVKEIKKIRSILKHNNYDVVIDLQNNRISRLVRFFSGAEYYSEFDKFSPHAAAERTLGTIRNAGFEDVENDCRLNLPAEQLSHAKHILFENGWDGKKKLVVLNPAGLWASRNWPLENYVKLAHLFDKEGDVNFLLIGNERLEEKAKYLSEKIGGSVINLTGKTKLDEVLAIFQFVYLTVTEDSALLHISWVSGVPTLALLGSTRADWTTPPPPHGASLNSNDLVCGNCMDVVCRFGDVHCLTRYTPGMVWEKAKELLSLHME